MILFLFIFWLITPGFSTEEEDLELAAALEESIRTHHQETAHRENGVISPSLEELQLAEALKRSINPAHDAKRSDTESDEDEEVMLERALALSLQKDEPKKPIAIAKELITKAQRSKTKTEYLKGLDPENYIENLIGYMVFLRAHLTTGFNDLIFDINKAAWDDLYKDLNLGKRAANNAFILLDEAKALILRQNINDSLLVDSMNHVMLELVAGKWGLSRKKLTADIKAKLKNAAVGIGRTMGNKGIDASQCAGSIFRYFDNGPLAKTVSDPLLRKHRLAAFAYIANGYKEGLIPERKALYTSQLAAAVQSNFTPEDLKGFSLKNLIEEPKVILTKIAKASATSSAKQSAFDRLVGSLKTAVHAENLEKLKAFLSTFDSGNIYEILANEDQLNSLKLFQRALQDKTRDEIEGVINSLIKNDLLPAEIRGIQDLLIEAAHYSPPSSIDRIYSSSAQTVKLEKKGDAEPLIGTNHEDLDAGLQLWILEYFRAIYQNGYYPRDAYIVKYPGVLDGREFMGDEEVTEAQAVKASEHMAAYSAAKDIKGFIFPQLGFGEKAVLVVTSTGAKIDIVREADGKFVREIVLNIIPGDQLDVQIGLIRRVVNQYHIDPNVLPASVEKKLIPSNLPKKSEYAVKGGTGISEEQKIQSRGRAIDVLIKQGRIDLSLKLPILLYLDNW